MTTYLTPKEAARYLDVPFQTLAQARSDTSRDGPRYTSPNGWNILYSIEDLDTWQANRSARSLAISEARRQRPPNALTNNERLRRLAQMKETV